MFAVAVGKVLEKLVSKQKQCNAIYMCRNNKTKTELQYQLGFNRSCCNTSYFHYEWMGRNYGYGPEFSLAKSVWGLQGTFLRGDGLLWVSLPLHGLAHLSILVCWQKCLDGMYVVVIGYVIAAVNFLIMGPSPLTPWMNRLVPSQTMSFFFPDVFHSWT